MLGMVFTELVEMVEDSFSPEVADRMLDAVQEQGGGAYTAVGSYPPEQVVAMVDKPAELTGVPAPDLTKAFGHHLLDRFAQGHPAHFRRHADLFDFLAAIDSEIHVEVHRLYPASELPRFEVLSRDAHRMGLRYRSARRMEMLALGLIERLAQRCGEQVRIAMEPFEDGCDFHIERLRP